MGAARPGSELLGDALGGRVIRHVDHRNQPHQDNTAPTASDLKKKSLSERFADYDQDTKQIFFESVLTANILAVYLEKFQAIGIFDKAANIACHPDHRDKSYEKL